MSDSIDRILVCVKNRNRINKLSQFVRLQALAQPLTIANRN